MYILRHNLYINVELLNASKISRMQIFQDFTVALQLHTYISVLYIIRLKGYVFYSATFSFNLYTYAEENPVNYRINKQNSIFFCRFQIILREKSKIIDVF